MPEHSDVHEAKPGKCPKCGMTLIPVMEQPKPEQSTNRPAAMTMPAKLYTCPMASDADVVSDKPGKCPKCEMDLVPTGHGGARQDRGGELAEAASGGRPAAQSTNTDRKGQLMLKGIIDFSLKNRFIVLLGTLALVLGGVYAVKNIPLDAIPDLSDVQVIIYTEWPGQAPQIVQDQVTYPITTKMLSVPKAKVVRGYSFYGFSFVYVIFEDGTDLYWARSRVLEYLSGLSGRLPKGVSPSLGPDATGVGWAFMYSINSTNRDLAELRSMQDWYLRYQLASVEGVAEVASVGGFVRQYQVTVDPTKLRAYNLSISEVAMAVKRSNGEVGGRSIELAEKEFILRVRGYVNKLDDLRKVTVGVGDKGVPILLGQVANVQFGPDMRRGIAELNGQGETVGGVVVVRYGANARQVILDVKKKLDVAMKGLPPDVTYSIAYDRSALIERAVKTLEEKLLEESIVVALVCLAFLMHLRSAFVAIVILPIAVLISFLVMFAQGISSNIMSLGGIAIAIGAMVDAVIIMIENAHKHMEHDQGKKPHWDIIRDASVEVGPTLFYSLLVITVSFFPIFMLTEQSGRMFKPLAFTKTYSMGAAALLSITLAPILMGFFIRGKIPAEEKNPINRLLIWLYHPVIDFVIKWRWAVVIAGRRANRVGVFPLEQAGGPPAAGRPGQGVGLQGRQDLPLPEPRLRIHAAALRRRPALHAHHLPRPRCHRGARDPPADRQDHQDLPRGAPRLRQDRPRRDRHRPRADGHDRNHHHAQARRGMAGGGHQRRGRQGHRPSPPHAGRVEPTR